MNETAPIKWNDIAPQSRRIGIGRPWEAFSFFLSLSRCTSSVYSPILMLTKKKSPCLSVFMLKVDQHLGVHVSHFIFAFEPSVRLCPCTAKEPAEKKRKKEKKSD
jgi:hypothetical protein